MAKGGVGKRVCFRRWFYRVISGCVSGVGDELSVRDEFGCTPLMTLLSEGVASEEYLLPRFDWLVGVRGSHAMGAPACIVGIVNVQNAARMSEVGSTCFHCGVGPQGIV